MKIAMIVLNSVENDARVLREARTLMAQGHELRMFGTADTSETAGRITLSGVDVDRTYLFELQFYRHFKKLFSKFKINRVQKKSAPVQQEAAVVAPSSLDYSGNYKFSKLSAKFKLLNFWRIAILYYSDFIFRKHLAAKIIAYKPDVLHCHDALPINLAVYLKKRLNCELIYDAHEAYDGLAYGGPIMRWWYEKIQLKMAKVADGWITVNNSIAKFYVDKYRLTQPMHVVFNSRSINERIDKYDNKLREHFGLPSSQKVLLFSGNFSVGRGLEQLMRCVGGLPDDWCLIMIGEGQMKGYLEQIAKSVSGGKQKVYFYPKVPLKDLANLLAQGDLGIISYEDNCLNHHLCSPNKIWEYAAAGLPLLTAPLKEIVYFVEKYNIGWTVDLSGARNLGSLLSGITREQLSEKKRSMENFLKETGWEKSEQSLLSLYQGLGAEL